MNETKPVNDESELPAPLLEFPCKFPLKIVGSCHDDYQEKLVEIIKKYDPEFNTNEATLKKSAKGNYLSLGVVVNATSQDMLDALYKELVDHSYTKFVL